MLFRSHRYAVAGVTPNFERVSQRKFPDELGNGEDDNNWRSLREAIGRARKSPKRLAFNNVDGLERTYLGTNCSESLNMRH